MPIKINNNIIKKVKRHTGEEINKVIVKTSNSSNIVFQNKTIESYRTYIYFEDSLTALTYINSNFVTPTPDGDIYWDETKQVIDQYEGMYTCTYSYNMSGEIINIFYEVIITPDVPGDELTVNIDKELFGPIKSIKEYIIYTDNTIELYKIWK